MGAGHFGQIGPFKIAPLGATKTLSSAAAVKPENPLATGRSILRTFSLYNPSTPPAAEGRLYTHRPQGAAITLGTF